MRKYLWFSTFSAAPRQNQNPVFQNYVGTINVRLGGYKIPRMRQSQGILWNAVTIEVGMGQLTAPRPATIPSPDKSKERPGNPPIFDATQRRQLYLCKELSGPMELHTTSKCYERGDTSNSPEVTTGHRAREHVHI